MAADAFSPWSDLCVPPDALRLAPTLLSGMSFRWHPSAAGSIYVGVLGDCIYELREDDATVHWRVCGPADSDRARAQLREHLSLDRGVTASAWAGAGQLPVQFFHAAAALPGVTHPSAFENHMPGLRRPQNRSAPLTNSAQNSYMCPTRLTHQPASKTTQTEEH